MSKNEYKEIKKSDNAWKKVKKRKNWLPYDVYKKVQKEKAGLIPVFVNSDWLGKDIDAPFLYREEVANHLYTKRAKDGTTKFVKHIPRGSILTYVPLDWWRGRSATPV